MTPAALANLLALAQNHPDPAMRLKLLQEWHRQRQVLQVREAILTCQECHLSRTRRSVVPWSGPTTAFLAFMGEGPGRDEDRLGVPFIGRAGRLLDQLIVRYLGMNRDQVFVFNTICCRAKDPATDKDRTPEEVEINACAKHREAQLAISQAKIVVILGATALRAIYPHMFLSVTRDHGRFFCDTTLPRWYFITFHPAAALRDPEKLRLLENDFSALAQFIRTFPKKDTELDPRPDLPDTAIWQVFAAAIASVDHPDTRKAFGLLHGFRCAGIRISIDGSGYPVLDWRPMFEEANLVYTPEQLRAMFRSHMPVIEQAMDRFRDWVFIRPRQDNDKELELSHDGGF